MDLGLRNAAVVISGGSKGMGRAAAETIAAEGARIAVLARSKDALEETVGALRELGADDAVGLSPTGTSMTGRTGALRRIPGRRCCGG